MTCSSCSLITWTCILVPVLYILYKLVTKKFNYFKDRGIPYTPGYPIFGSTLFMTIQQLSMSEWFLDLAHEFRAHRFYGLFNHAGPTFVLQDPELIKQITVKDFDNFTNHPNSLTIDCNDLLGNALNVLRDQKWKDMRATLSPTFTGAKMRMMFDLVRECADDFVKYCHENCQNGLIEIDTKEIYTKVNINVIATTAFGLNIDSFRDPLNPVLVNAKKSFDIRSLKAQFKFLMIAGFPKLARALKLSFTPADSNQFFKKLVADTIDHRRKTKQFRPDVIQLLIQAQDGTLKSESDSKEDDGFSVVEESDLGKKEVKNRQWSDMEIASQCFVFFVAGFDTTSTFLQFASYELAVNEDVQEKIYNEILETKRKLEGKPINYESLNKMQYLDAFVSETLRVHPPGFYTDRLCNADTEIEDYNGKKFTIQKGVHVWCNIYSVHHSHKYFPNPEKFDPERFLGENKAKINTNAFLAFGSGPRACIASRFALMQVKTILYAVLSDFKIVVCDKTMVPMRYKSGFALTPKHDLYVEFKKR